MTFTIVASGESAKDWIPNGYNLGCNDAAKWGKPLDGLLVCNRPETFSKERQEIIINTKPKDFYSNKSNWDEHYPNWQKVRLHCWAGTLHNWNRKDGLHGYSSSTSPIIAITLAYHLGAKEIILWGVDFKTHKIFHESSPETKREVKVYLDVIGQLKEKGVKVWLGASGTAFDDCVSGYVTKQVNAEV